MASSRSGARLKKYIRDIKLQAPELINLPAVIRALMTRPATVTMRAMLIALTNHPPARFERGTACRH